MSAPGGRFDFEDGEDEAWAVADKAISYFKHAGQDDFLALGVAVVDVGQAQDRTTLLVDEAARRVGFDVQIRYTRINIPPPERRRSGGCGRRTTPTTSATTPSARFRRRGRWPVATLTLRMVLCPAL